MVFDAKNKLKRLGEAYMKSSNTKNKSFSLSECISIVDQNYFDLNYSKMNLNDVIGEIVSYEKDYLNNLNHHKLRTNYANLYVIFLACDTNEIRDDSFNDFDLNVFIRQFNLDKTSIDARFCEYLNYYPEILFNDSMGSDYSLEHMKMISKVLL